jgi:hypothetical protein
MQLAVPNEARKLGVAEAWGLGFDCESYEDPAWDSREVAWTKGQS